MPRAGVIASFVKTAAAGRYEARRPRAGFSNGVASGDDPLAAGAPWNRHAGDTHADERKGTWFRHRAASPHLPASVQRVPESGLGVERRVLVDDEAQEVDGLAGQ